MTRDRPGTGQLVAKGAAGFASRTEELTSRLVDGLNHLSGRVHRSAQRARNAAQDLRTPAVLQHAVAARERGNLEAAFWLFNEEFSQHPNDPSVALPYWDVALSFGRGDIASPAGVKLVEIRAANGEAELAAQHWIELIKEAPDALVSPITIATILPALKARLAKANDDGPDDRQVLAGYLRSAVRHAVDPRNTGLHPGVALRIFQEGRKINPEASRRAAEIALESPHLHEAKRERLIEWLAGDHAEAPDPEPSLPPQQAEPEPDRANARIHRLSEDEIATAAARLRKSKPAPLDSPMAEAPIRPSVERGTLIGIEDDALIVKGAPNGRLPYNDIQAVAVAEIMGLEDQSVTVIDLILNWIRRYDEPLEIVRLRLIDLDLESLVTHTHALGSHFAALMGDILERTHAIPLPDPESALGTRITCYESPERYERAGLRVPERAI
ncbi:MAG: hypothetical protein JRJ05_05415 [Deltaproteobacteria bacterium]|nr:hypothetical protein [Deltaproteobacteria bacterium]